MTRHSAYDGSANERSILDYLLYILAGSALATVSFSFLLWLRF